MVCSTQTVHLSSVKISAIFKRTEVSLEPRQIVVPLGASKMTSKPIVHLAQTMHLYCTDTNIVSKWKEGRFDMTHVV
jgi:hypothetical protein